MCACALACKESTRSKPRLGENSHPNGVGYGAAQRNTKSQATDGRDGIAMRCGSAHNRPVVFGVPIHTDRRTHTHTYTHQCAQTCTKKKRNYTPSIYSMFRRGKHFDTLLFGVCARLSVLKRIRVRRRAPTSMCVCVCACVCNQLFGITFR